MMSVTISKEWVGRTVDGKFSLLTWLGGSEGCGVFLTEYPGSRTGKAVIKLMPAEAAQDRAAGWDAAQGLNHPHLLRLYEHGRCHEDGAEFAWVLTEYAPEVLAEILAERALTADETRGVLEPLMDALEYLHGKGLVHGHVKPSNIMANDDVLKLTADHLLRAGTVSGASAKGSYAAPETARGVATPAADIWSLGATLVEVLTQKSPARGTDGELLIPGEIPVPFAEIARECLRVDPAQRCSLREIRAMLDPETPSAKAGITNAVAPPPATPAARPAVTPVAATTTRRSRDAKPRGQWIWLVGIPVLVIIVAIAWFLRTEAGRNSPASESSASVVQESSSASSAPVPAMVKGSVAERVPPEVLRSALETIRGTVRVDVQVTVGEGGNVTGAAFTEHGPSHYFANAAMQAAQQWIFKPAQVHGLPVKSIWLLKFAFTQGGDSVTAAEVSP